ncbi:related to TOB3 (member of AAA-ATPase family) [Cephalotrichum gorgonifer]|uniref:Related to TOB3 (Member of AAA-ATPase family) n=1 Tax=Cephalotrichum gorgonifer TaxID=2041049 RepID=A0AAE8T085_9PEZI|nr:related to TOB3 (member of AAA-ATPase family) [Cephalotrichum gorgonifer]
MARTKGTARKATRRTIRPRTNLEKDAEFLAAQKEQERRERILADRRRIAAKWRPKIPEVRKVNFENFKNRFQDIDEPDYAIDVLVGGSSIKGQIRREQGYRRREELQRIRQRWLMNQDNTPERRKGTDTSERVRRDKRTDALNSSDMEIQRVRIQSQPVLGHLTSLLNDTEQRSSPRTFMTPFKPLIYFQPKMKQILATLEEKWADFEEVETPESDVVDVASSDDAEVVEAPGENGDQENDAGDDDDDTESLVSVDSAVGEDFDSLMDSPEALRDMRCYVNFVDTEIIPLHARFDDSSAERVKFDQLWSLYRPGDLIYMPSSGETGGRYHEVWRIYRTKAPEPETTTQSSKWEFFADDLQGNDSDSKFKISAYYVDHDGSKFGAVRRKFEIESFVGEREITSLEVYPIRYRQGYQQLLGELREQGQKFVDFLDNRHQQYSAWTLTRNPPSETTEPDDEILQDERYDSMRHPEFLESDVIVDLTEAYQSMPTWRPNFHQLALNKSIRCEVSDDELPIQHWFDGSRQTLAYTQNELIQKTDGVEARQRRDNLAADVFLRCRVKGSRMFETNPEALSLTQSDLVLVPKRMFAYALRERRFMPIDLNFLNPVRREKGVFDNLRIQEEYKDVVNGLVMSHFQRKDLERRYAEEAVAMENRKPLFVITCGDLGLTPGNVESSLKNVFRLAHLWNCVLLLDEADVFLSQRSKSDMKRNALVSVFLRVLEYYNGLLFLTTNRVGTIDEAFKSRIHLSLYYPPLDRAQTRDIFRLNIAKLKQIESERHRMTGEPAIVINESEVLGFAASHYDDLARSTGCWNGRQIRSAFQIASSLALHDYNKQAAAARARGQMPPAAPLLGRALFDKVQMTTQSFDKHMTRENAIQEPMLRHRGSFSEER